MRIYPIARTLDYLYAARWQVGSVLKKVDANTYRRESTNGTPTILLIPGVYEDWYFMRPVAEVLYAHGYDVRAVEDLRYNTGEIEDAAHIIGQFIARERIKSCIIVAHSKGGLIGKYLLLNHNAAKVIKQVIAINTPFAGSVYARLLPIRSLRMFRPSSTQLRTLKVNSLINAHIVSFYSTFDPHVPKGSYLHGATNIAIDEVGHFKILANHTLHAELLRHIDS